MNTSIALISVRDFKRRYEALLQDIPAPDLALANVDISTEDLKYKSEFDITEELIRKDLKGEPIVGVEFPVVDRVKEIANAHLASTNDKHEDFPKNRKKEVNYITDQMQQLYETQENIPFAPIPPNEVVLQVTLYHHLKKDLKTQEFLVLGSQPLTALKDKIYCLYDRILESATTKSGYFFIENVFYNDLRDPNSIDYSKTVIDWVNENERYTQPGLGVYTSKRMEDMTFYDLAIRIGAPYLYVHQGNCEHTLVFSEMRLLHDQDNKNYNMYPLHIFQSKIRRKKCKICDIYSAKYVTFGDPVSPENPCFYCEHCYRPLHYSYEGKLLFSDFSVYPYYHE